MDPAKIRLSAYESALVKDAQVLLTKRRIIDKVVNFFAGFSTIAAIQFPEGLAERFSLTGYELEPRISRGENYKGLPYVMLDCPRRFSSAEIFAIRMMFWWGNYISITLHVKGPNIFSVQEAVSRHFELLANSGYYISTGVHEWDHDIKGEAYRPLAGMPDGKQSLTGEIPFMKIAVFFDIDDWIRLPLKLEENYRLLVAVLNR